MVSRAHQWLLLWLARKMTVDGYTVGGYDGPTPHGGVWNALPRPFEFARVRPDIWSIATSSGEIAIGEAKTLDDIVTVHTRAQLRVFGRLRRRRTSQLCRLYLAVPRSGAHLLDHVLADVQLLGSRHVTRIHVPDCLLHEDRHGHP